MPRLSTSSLNRIICGDATQVLKGFPAESIDCVITSPPYWSLRDYGVHGQIGLEPTVSDYLTKLCTLFDQVRRVLKPAGTCWVNLGDAYATRGVKGVRQPQPILTAKANQAQAHAFTRPKAQVSPKCLVQIPARFVLAMIERGWILRNEIIWYKPNCMPQSARDRFTVDFEKLFFFVKQRYYYFAQQFEPLRDLRRATRPLIRNSSVRKRQYGDPYVSVINPNTAEASQQRMLMRGRNKRCVWKIAPRPFRGPHFAVFPEELVETPLRAGCPRGGVVLDPFIGSGTTALVARRLGRDFIGIDLNPQYVRLARQRLTREAQHT